MSKPLAERFWAKVKRGNACWIWKAYRNANGYGTIGQGGRQAPHLLAHRVSWMIHFGPIPEKLAVLHKCDNPACVKPSHLFLGTHDDNMKDAAVKGRTAKGEGHGLSKLKKSAIFLIRSMECRQTEIADTFGITQSNVSRIRNNHTWKHIQ
jgi:hypothetical protein